MAIFGLISQIALILSGVGIIVFVFKKIPRLLAQQETALQKKNQPSAYSKFKNTLLLKIKNKFLLKYFSSYEMLLQKLLTQVRILTLKTDSKTFNWMKGLREKTKEKKLGNSNYWKELRKPKIVK